ncbi:redoxin family protein [Adhaeribacter radiodurans]|uniref:Redoxin domain-containing protein n=1 Tax=Adhaeribacter radiodurans TaxID=2745197 RepID=A0A7L7L411_9BACT|nr:redoxin family protein [Adhaeribacter radiodurans]QMU27520.1 redoxin domain-containing protein [Adhaeribacter radiodurans]
MKTFFSIRIFKNCFFFLILLLAATRSLADDPKTLEIGASAPDFSLPGVDGKTYSLKSFANAKILTIIFTCNHCPTAQAYEDRMKVLVTDYKNKGVAVVAVSPNYPQAVALDEMGYTDSGDSFEEMKIRAKDKGYNFPYLFDGETEIMSKAYGPMATPHVFVFDQQRKLQYTGRLDASEKPGSANAEDTRNALDALLAGKPVAVPKTKTFGCSIKWQEKSDWAKKAPLVWAKEPVDLTIIEEADLKALLKNDTDKVRLVNVWATWCGPCVAEMPEFVNINRMYRNREFEFITISADKPDKKDKALATLKRLQASNKNYLWSSEDKYKLIEAIDPQWQGALPYTLLIEPGGKVAYRTQGSIVPMEMKKMIVSKIGRYY